VDAERILEQGFTDSRFNAFDSDSAARGVYLCTGRGNVHSGGNPALLAVEVPEDVLRSMPSDRCPLADTDYLIPAETLNAYPVERLE